MVFGKIELLGDICKSGFSVAMRSDLSWSGLGRDCEEAEPSIDTSSMEF